MNGSGFGFPAYPQRPSVTPQQMGDALAKLGAASAPAPSGGEFPPTSVAVEPPVPPSLVQPTGAHPVSLQLASQEAARRGYQGRPQYREPPAPFTLDQLARFGLSPAEIALLRQNGGVK